MQLERVAKLTYRPMEGEEMDPFILPPWCMTAGDRGSWIIVTGVPKNSKKSEEAKRHKEEVRKREQDESQVIVYLDGSMWEDKDRQSKTTEWGIVGYHMTNVIFADRGGLGKNAEVYDVELMGIAKA